MTTLKDIAERVGVSQMTVSKALSGRLQGANAKTRSRIAEIERVALELGYRPHAGAKAMASGRHGAIGILHLQEVGGNPTVFTGFLRGVQHAVAGSDQRLIIEAIDPAEADVPKLLRELAVDGLLVDILDRQLVGIADSGVPTIWVNARRAHDCVRPDDQAAAADATRALIARGHRRITFASFGGTRDPAQRHYSFELRRAGYDQAMAEAGLSPEHAVTPVAVARELRDHAAALLATGRRPSAILAADSATALPLWLEAERAGVRVPRQLSLAAINDLSWWQSGLPLDGPVHPAEAMGRMAVELLQRKMAAPERRIRTRTVPFVQRTVGTVEGVPCVS